MRNQGHERNSRVLAFDVRPQWLGFAAFEAPAKLLDFGVTRLRSREAGPRRLSFLVNTLRPAIIVLRRVAPGSVRDHPRTKSLVRAIECLSLRYSIRVEFVNESQLRDHLRRRDARTKQETASLLARDFPDLRWIVPPPRRLWQHEHRNMPVFDAAALGVSYFALANKEDRA